MSDLRASDADREAVAAALQRHHVAGRLDGDELEQRLGEAFAARTLGQLQALTSDLPRGRRTVAPIDPEANRVRGFGTREFVQRYELSGRPKDLYDALLGHVVPPLAGAGYTVVNLVDPHTIVLELEQRSGWLLIVGLLPFLLAKDRSRVVFSIAPIDDSTSRLTISGQAPRAVRKWMTKFGDA